MPTPFYLNYFNKTLTSDQDLNSGRHSLVDKRDDQNTPQMLKQVVWALNFILKILFKQMKHEHLWAHI